MLCDLPPTKCVCVPLGMKCALFFRNLCCLHLCQWPCYSEWGRDAFLHLLCCVYLSRGGSWIPLGWACFSTIILKMARILHSRACTCTCMYSVCVCVCVCVCGLCLEITSTKHTHIHACVHTCTWMPNNSHKEEVGMRGKNEGLPASKLPTCVPKS